MEKLFDTTSIGEYSGHHWDSKELRNLLIINVIASLFGLIEHV